MGYRQFDSKNRRHVDKLAMLEQGEKLAREFCATNGFTMPAIVRRDPARWRDVLADAPERTIKATENRLDKARRLL